MLSLTTPIDQAPHVGPKTAERLKKLDLKQVRDLLAHWPYRYEDFRNVRAIARITPGEINTVRGVITLIRNQRSFRRRMIVTEALLKDASGTVKILWFNQGYLAKTVKAGDELIVAGKVSDKSTVPLFPNPTFEKVKTEQTHVGRIVPIYHTTEKLTQRQLRYILKSLVPLMHQLPDFLPAAVISQHRLLALNQAYVEIHFPSSHQVLAMARRRLQFDELFLIHLHVAQTKRSLAAATAQPLPADPGIKQAFISSLPFQLTSAQQQAATEILSDCAQARPMNRLLEGDVGSGKTVVAALAARLAIAAGSQVVFMAPTEVLAYQHYQTLTTLLGPAVTVALFTRSYRTLSTQAAAPTKIKLKRALADGTAQLVVGTHALIQEDVRFKNLHFAVVDEQHRFGVNARKALRDKGSHPDLTPHLLSMTATPIPRTLALTVYGDLDISLIDTLPAGRKKIITRIVDQAHRLEAYRFVEQQVASGRQVFVICPLIEISDKLGYRSVTAEYEKLKTSVFPHRRIGQLHGKMKTAAKEAVITALAKGEIDVLVATSVVEVGIDIPNASVMMIEGADRFGLAQLHQFRGRVGRSEHQSYCLLFTESSSQQTLLRLRALTESDNGFALAEKDLALRGPGEIYGTRQSGEPDVKLVSLTNVPLIKETKEAATRLLQVDPELKQHPKLQARVNAFIKTIHWE